MGNQFAITSGNTRVIFDANQDNRITLEEAKKAIKEACLEFINGKNSDAVLETLAGQDKVFDDSELKNLFLILPPGLKIEDGKKTFSRSDRKFIDGQNKTTTAPGAEKTDTTVGPSNKISDVTIGPANMKIERYVTRFSKLFGVTPERARASLTMLFGQKVSADNFNNMLRDMNLKTGLGTALQCGGIPFDLWAKGPNGEERGWDRFFDDFFATKGHINEDMNVNLPWLQEYFGGLNFTIEKEDSPFGQINIDVFRESAVKVLKAKGEQLSNDSDLTEIIQKILERAKKGNEDWDGDPEFRLIKFMAENIEAGLHEQNLNISNPPDKSDTAGRAVFNSALKTLVFNELRMRLENHMPKLITGWEKIIGMDKHAMMVVLYQKANDNPELFKQKITEYMSTGGDIFDNRRLRIGLWDDIVHFANTLFSKKEVSPMQSGTVSPHESKLPGRRR